LKSLNKKKIQVNFSLRENILITLIEKLKPEDEEMFVSKMMYDANRRKIKLEKEQRMKFETEEKEVINHYIFSASNQLIRSENYQVKDLFQATTEQRVKSENTLRLNRTFDLKQQKGKAPTQKVSPELRALKVFALLMLEKALILFPI